MNRFLSAIVAIFIAVNTFAIPASPKPVEKTQSDGTKITVRLKGDEKVHWMESLDGYTLMYNNKQDIVFAIKNNEGDLQPSNILYKGQDLNDYSQVDRQTISSLSKRQSYSKRQQQLLKQLWEITDANSTSAGAITPKAVTSPVITPVVGEKKLLCILANFTDKKISNSHKVEIPNLMNQIGYTDGGNAGSVKDFYRANSYGKMDVTVTVVGPVELTHTAAYYADGQGDIEFPKEVATLANAELDWSQFAINGSVPTFHILFAGYGDEAIDNGNQIWSHASAFVKIIGEDYYYDRKTFDGVLVGDRYSCSPVLAGDQGSTLTGIGVICHELCHTFGAPDFYDTDDENDNGILCDGTGQWDLMADGSWNDYGYTPAHINMFQKIMFGWVNPIELTDSATVTNMPNSADSAVAYTIKVNANGDMYVLENRQQKGFDKYVPGSGLLIYHAHPNALSGDASNAKHPQEMYVVAAGNSNAIPTTVSRYGTINSTAATFGGLKKDFSSTSIPRMFSWSGTSGSGLAVDKPLTKITKSGQYVSFDFMGGGKSPTQTEPEIVDTIRIPYFESFENVIGTNLPKSWTNISTPDGSQWKIEDIYYEATDGGVDFFPAYDGTKYASIEYDVDVALDAWMFTPKIELEAGKTYRFSFMLMMDNEYNFEYLDVKLGQNAAPEAMTTTIFSYRTDAFYEWTKQEIILVPTSTSCYNIGFHALSPKNRWFIIIDDIKIEEDGDGSKNIAHEKREQLLTAWVSDDVLHIAGLSAEKPFYIYNTAGVKIYENIAKDKMTTLPASVIKTSGIYIIKSENNSIKLYKN